MKYRYIPAPFNIENPPMRFSKLLKSYAELIPKAKANGWSIEMDGTIDSSVWIVVLRKQRLIIRWYKSVIMKWSVYLDILS